MMKMRKIFRQQKVNRNLALPRVLYRLSNTCAHRLLSAGRELMVMVVANGLHTEATAKKMKVDDLRALLLPNKPVPPVRASAAGCRSDSSARKMGAPTDAQLAAEARRLSGGAN